MNSTASLRCMSCGRMAGSGSNGVDTVLYLGSAWCTICASVRRTPSGPTFVDQPSPGAMYESAADDALAAWQDCYSMKPKQRIKKDQAKAEIQRAWAMWDGDKSDSESAMFMFLGWAGKFRPYFLTFRCKGDPWQTIHSWLIQAERKHGR